MRIPAASTFPMALDSMANSDFNVKGIIAQCLDPSDDCSFFAGQPYKGLFMFLKASFGR